MKQHPLEISKTLSLPLDAVTQKFAFLGRTGSGKTYAAMKLAEEMISANAQVIALDGIGIWHGLRTAADGKSKGLSIPIFGGEFGDIPINAGSGELLAELLVTKGISAIIDVSNFRKGERKTFMVAFAEHLFHLKKKHKSAVHIFIEESQMFIPQRTIKGEERMLGAMEDLCKLGRNYGIGISLISQRPQSVHKDCLNQTEALFCFQINGPHERKAIEDWVIEKGEMTKAKLVNELSGLQPGNCFVWSPQWLKVFKQIKISKKSTYDASSTPMVGSTATSARKLAPVDLEALKTQLRGQLEQAKENDPKELKWEVVRLKAENIKLQKLLSEKEKEIEKTPIIQDPVSLENSKKLHNMLVLTERVLNIEIAGLLKTSKTLDEWHEIVGKTIQEIVPEKPITVTVKNTVKTIPAANTFRISDYQSLPKCETALLTALAQRAKPSSKAQIGILSGYSSKSGGFNNSLGKLRGLGYITGSGDQLTATQEGINALGNFTPLPEGEDLHRYWINKLPKCESTLLKVLLEQGEMSKEDLGIQSDYSHTSGGFNNALGKLRTLELISGSKTLTVHETLLQ